ncbi:MAG: hypothetical protein WCK57_00730 [Verrucomicrobiae bacterium]
MNNRFGETLEIEEGKFFLEITHQQVLVAGRLVPRELIGMPEEEWEDLPETNRNIGEIRREISKLEAQKWFLSHQMPEALLP